MFNQGGEPLLQILGDPSVLEELAASAPPEAILDITPTPGPQNHNLYFNKIPRRLACTLKFEKYCFEIIDGFPLWLQVGVDQEVFKYAAPTPKSLMYLVWDGAWALLSFKNPPQNSQTARVENYYLI